MWTQDGTEDSEDGKHQNMKKGLDAIHILEEIKSSCSHNWETSPAILNSMVQGGFLQNSHFVSALQQEQMSDTWHRVEQSSKKKLLKD